MLDWSLKFQFFDLSKITVFVLDEADVMIATQVGPHVLLKVQIYPKGLECAIKDELLNFRDTKIKVSESTRTLDLIARCCFSLLLMIRYS